MPDRFIGSEEARRANRIKAMIQEARSLPCRAELADRTVTIPTTRDWEWVKREKIDKIGRYIPYGVTITIQFEDGGHNFSKLMLYGFHGGGKLIVQGNTGDTEGLSVVRTVTIKNELGADAITICGCSCEILIQQLRLRGGQLTMDGYGVYSYCNPGSHIYVRWCDFRGFSTSYGAGIYAEKGGTFDIQENYFRTHKYSVYAGDGVHAYLNTNDDGTTQPQYGYYFTESAIGHRTGTYPTGSVGSNTAVAPAQLFS